MPKKFLQAGWRNLLMANYVTDASLLKQYVPAGTELDDFNGRYYISLVGFLFMDTKVLGVGFPFHRTFEEVNLRFYVKYKEQTQWKRGVVFVKEIVPLRLISLIANRLYGEKYVSLPMRHYWMERANNTIAVEYYWRVNNNWNYLKAIAGKEPIVYTEGSEENFITEHYWGYTCRRNNGTSEYQVTHPQWRIHPVHSYDIHCSIAELYGKEFEATLQQPPRSVFLAEGSEICVMRGKRI
ncbi:MAG TPA: DUF2071 domain-containing protein [Chitinophagaceae bacterium]|nr:DUF2071 domain-containing protein [Chitinophagaceae bacterium]